MKRTFCALKLLLSWGEKRGLLERNRALGVGRLHRGDRRDSSWSEVQIEAFLATAPEPLRRALILAVETGQRQSDLLALQWSQISDNVIQLQQAKTRARVAIPISAQLAAALGESPTDASAFVLTTGAGEPWESKGNGFRSAWRKACAKADVHGVTFHDLRGTFVTRRLAEGWTTSEVAMCTGHSLRDLAMLDVYADRATIANATARRIAERMAHRSETNSANCGPDLQTAPRVNGVK